MSGEWAIMGDVSVVVATRNRIAGLLHAVGHLTELPDPPPVIVVDNGSSDGTPDRVRRAFPQVTVIELGRNAGATARNRGVAAAETPYVAFADDDSWWASDALPRIGDLFDRHPRLALIAARTLVGPDERVDPMSAFMATAPLGTPPDMPGPAVLGFLACGAAVRRDAFLTCGGFDPVVFFMGEEARVAYDLSAAGWGLAYCADVVAHHHPERAGGSAHKRRLAARNRALTAWMRRPVRTAADHTADLLRDAVRARDVGTLTDFAVRLPRALLQRHAPDPTVETALVRLTECERKALAETRG
jgi:GT2 family glycosyltransferase